MTAKRNTDVVPVTNQMHDIYVAEGEKSGSGRRGLSAAINASPELTKLIAENEQLILDNARMREALEKLARLGNGTCYGNSIGNNIAKQALGEQS